MVAVAAAAVAAVVAFYVSFLHLLLKLQLKLQTSVKIVALQITGQKSDLTTDTQEMWTNCTYWPIPSHCPTLETPLRSTTHSKPYCFE